MPDHAAVSRLRTKEMRIAVLGMGHVGIPTAAGLAELGWRVTGVDQDLQKMASLREERLTFYEPDLQELVSKHIRSGRFLPTDDMDAAIQSADILFVCVGTPQRNNGEADLSQVEAVARAIARNLNGYKLIVEKSTVPAITAQWIKKTILRYAKTTEDTATAPGAVATGPEAGTGKPGFDIASNPEFFREGRAVHDFFHPDRIVCGVESDRAWEILSEIYRPLDCPVLRTDPNTAELIKHCANAFLATKISFINMVADLCETVRADVTQVVQGIGLDRRIGPEFFRPGIGFGGYCLPKDLRSFIHLAESHRVDFSLLKEVERINNNRIGLFLKKVHDALWVLQGKTIGILGLAFKPDTDDIREAPSIRILEGLLGEGASLRLYDPRAAANLQCIHPEREGKIHYCSSAYDAASGAHALLLLTEWDEFRNLDLAKMRSQMEVPILLDGRNLYDPSQARAAGFEYISIGR
jgi:UDPglucose 6-dehydrogenase